MILALETATRACSAALFAPSGELLGQRHAEDGPAHTQLLLPFVHAVLSGAGADIEAVGTVVVSLGPGSYTGLRIGVATARALASAGAELQLAGVPTLAALAWALAADSEAVGPRCVVPLIDGRRREVFAACYEQRRGGLRPLALTGVDGRDAHEAVVPVDRLGEFLAAWPDALVGGDGAHLHADRLPAGVRLSSAVAAPTAVMVGRAFLAGVPGCVAGLADVLPIYGRTPDAVRWAQAAEL
jgi:tRNA threonylcarbamoyl adenosine modification protein YeaZ